jgi:hypothetical protein
MNAPKASLKMKVSQDCESNIVYSRQEHLPSKGYATQTHKSSVWGKMTTLCDTIQEG